MNRRAALGAFLAALVPAAARSAAPAVVRIASAADDDVTPILYAQRAGLFSRAGLDVRLERLSTGAVVAAAVASGHVDIGKSSLMAIVAAHARGLPFTVLAPSGLYDTADPTAKLIVPRDSAIRTARDLNGKTIPTTALNELMQIATEAWVDRRGGDWRSLHFIEMPGSAIAPALADGRVAAATLHYPYLQVALDSGRFRVLGQPLDAIAPRFPIAVWFAGKGYVGANRDAVDRFVAVLRDASLWTNAHHRETVPLLAAFADLPAAVIARMHRATSGTRLEPGDLQPLIDAAARYGVIARPFEARELVDGAS